MNIKKEFWKLMAGLGYIMGLIFVIRYFKLGFLGVYLLLVGTSYVFLWFRWYFKNEKLKINHILGTPITILMIMGFFKWLNRFGIVGYIIGIIGITGFILFKKRKRYVEVKQHVESMLWGKPLKEFINNKEKPPKLKFVLKK